MKEVEEEVEAEVEEISVAERLATPAAWRESFFTILPASGFQVSLSLKQLPAAFEKLKRGGKWKMIFIPQGIGY